MEFRRILINSLALYRRTCARTGGVVWVESSQQMVRARFADADIIGSGEDYWHSRRTRGAGLRCLLLRYITARAGHCSCSDLSQDDAVALECAHGDRWGTGVRVWFRILALELRANSCNRSRRHRHHRPRTLSHSFLRDLSYLL